MGNRPRIAMPNAQQKARTAVRELYSDLIDHLTNAECDLIVQARIDQLGSMFIVDLITRKRNAAAERSAEKQSLYEQMKNARAQA
jgi:hypothetical protein